MPSWSPGRFSTRRPKRATQDTTSGVEARSTASASPVFLQDRDLIAVELLAAEFGRIFGARIDQHGVDPGAPEHRRRQRAGEPAADDGDIGRVHRGRPRLALFRPAAARQARPLEH